MAAFLPETLSQWSGGEWTSSCTSPVLGFAYDTRQLEVGQMFVALSGGERDGHDYLAQAKANGATAALVSRKIDVDMPQLVVADTLKAFQEMARCYRATLRNKVTVIGVTGSCGKTSTKDLLGLLLGKERTLVTAGNLNNHIGLPLTVLRINANQHTYAVIEAGTNAPGEIDLLGSILRPDLALVTVIGECHLEGLGSLAGVAEEKAGLGRSLQPDGKLYIHEDTATYDAFGALSDHSVIAVNNFPDGASETAPVGVNWTETELKGDGRRVTIWRPSSALVEDYQLPFASSGMVRNTVLAIALVRDLGIPVAQIEEGLAGWSAGKLRGEIRTTERAWFYADCYNANPTSMRDSIATFQRKAPAGKKRLYVLGCMNELGPDAMEIHRVLGSTLHFDATDTLVVIGREAEAFSQGLCESGVEAKQIVTLPQTMDAAEMVNSFNGAIFLKGSRSYRLEQLLPAHAEMLTERQYAC